MTEVSLGDQLEQFVRERAGDAYVVEAGAVWLTVKPDSLVLPDHGWKLHVSSRAATFGALVELLLPLLITQGCAFKLARSAEVLAELNDGHTAPASVGKAITVYPDQERVRDLGLRLASVLGGHSGPRVLSDRRIGTSSVYYRYGAFAAEKLVQDSRGKFSEVITGPGGEEFDLIASLTYRQPSWVVDPFEAEPVPAPQKVIGDHYLVTDGVRESAVGNVYRAVDRRTDLRVIVKQARAMVAEHGDQNDARMRIRNERRILRVLDGVCGVPQFVDHFRHTEDEYLVSTDCGPRTLASEVQQNGPYERLDRLASELARILSEIHQRGVTMRDLSPKNVVIAGDEVSVVDFGLSDYDGVYLPGGTPGYAPARQHRDEQPQDIDDIYALGMTLFYAATTLDPIAIGKDPDVSRIRALQTIRSLHGMTPPDTVLAIADLLSDDAETARQALRDLVDGKSQPSHPQLPPFPPLTRELIAEITENTRADLLAMVDKVLVASPDLRIAQDASLYSGTAGIGLELLHGPESTIIADLADFTIRAAQRADLQPGLFTGTTGVDLFLQEAGIAPPRIPPPDWKPSDQDVIRGAAGIGLAHLHFYRTGNDPAHLDIARRCTYTLIDANHDDWNASIEGNFDPAAGRAHGLAGLVALLTDFAGETADPVALEAAACQTKRLAARTEFLIEQSRERSASPLALSWCQGLAGIGKTLVSAGTVLNDPYISTLARQTADACIPRIARFSLLGQCCGAAGLGCFFLDLAVLDEDQRYLDAALQVATQMMLRSAGTPAHPQFTDPEPNRLTISWAAGLAGILPFFRRLADVPS